MEKIIAIDIGSVRIGVAESDPFGSFAQAVTVLSSGEDWIGELARIMAERNSSKLLVGLPVRTNGSEGPEALKVREEAAVIGGRIPGVEIIFWDERFTTVMARRSLIEGDVSRKGRKGRIDKIAAAILLQSYLDNRRGF